MPSRILVVALLTALLGSCAAYDGFGLQPGTARVEDMERVMGQSAMRWNEADGGETLVYPRGPMGYHTFFVRIDARGTVLSRENVLDTRHFADPLLNACHAQYRQHVPHIHHTRFHRLFSVGCLAGPAWPSRG